MEIVARQIDMDVIKQYYPSQRVIEGQCVLPHVRVEGRDYLQVESLDYLGLAADERVVEAYVRAARQYYIGAYPSRLSTGTMDIHLELEQELAKFLGMEASVVFTSGMLTNLGAIPAIINSPHRGFVGSGKKLTRAIYVDELAHASIIDAIKLADVNDVFPFRHNNMASLRRHLSRGCFDLKMILVDATYSMDGDLAKLVELVDLADEFDAVLYPDDAHGVGVLGKNGRGTLELLGVENRVDIRMGVISKAFGCLGGYFAADDPELIQYMVHCRTQMFSMGIPASDCGACLEAIRIASAEPHRRQQVLDTADYLRQKLQEKGFDTMNSTTHIVPIFIGDDMLTQRIEEELFSRGVLARAITRPATRRNRARFRALITYHHTRSDIDFFVDALSEAVKAVGETKSAYVGQHSGVGL